MTWNYRVVRRKLDDGEILYSIHEAYYDGRRLRRPHSITADPVTLSSESGAGLQAEIERMQQALMLPPIDYDTQLPIGTRAAVLAKGKK